MLGSQALETAIGLTLMFFVLATAASTIVEVVSRCTKKRAIDLERGIEALLAGDAPDAEVDAAMNAFKGTTVYAAAQRVSAQGRLRWRQRRPTYLSAKAFADAATELLFDDAGALNELPVGLRKRLVPLVNESRDSAVRVKAGLERWFDETMAQVEAAYKRWATTWLFFVGLGLAVAANASTFHVAQELWTDTVTRGAVVDAAAGVAEGEGAAELDSVAATTSALTEFRLPVGYQQCDDDSQACTEFSWSRFDGTIWLSTFAGWLITALLVMLGGPFWFDLLGRLVSLRSSGDKPAPAGDDPGSATSIQQRAASRTSALVAVADPQATQPASPTSDDFAARLRSTFGLP